MPQSNSGQRTVLLVGRGRDQAAIETALRESGLDPETVAGPVEAVLRAARGADTVEAVLIRSASLGDEADLQAVGALRRTLPRATIVVLYDSASRERAARALLAGADATLSEPFYWVELRALLQRRPIAPAPEVAPGSPPDVRREIERVGRLAGGVAHEINNPLTIISGWVQVLLSEVPETDPRYHTLLAIRDEAFRIARIVADLQTYARSRPPDVAPLDLVALLRSEIDGPDLKPRIEKLHVTTRIEEGLPAALADAAQVREVLRHLVRNAVAATAEGGEIVLELAASPGVLCVTVRDTGRGIPAEERDRIFDPFFPGSPGGPGPGLGLAVSRAIARNHGGDLVLLESGTSGSALRLTLPASGRGPAEPPAGPRPKETGA